VKWPQAQGLKLLLVRPYRLGDLPPGAAPVAGARGLEPTDDLVVCADTLDAGPGRRRHRRVRARGARGAQREAAAG
jgi:hypothetical protein